MGMVPDRAVAALDAGWGDHSNYDSVGETRPDRAAAGLPDQEPAVGALGASRTTSHPKRRHRRREVALAGAVALGVAEGNQGQHRPPVLERAVHAAADEQLVGHHLPEIMAHLALGRPASL